MSPKKAGSLFLLLIVLHLYTAFFYTADAQVIPLLGRISVSSVVSEAILILPTLICACMTDEAAGEMFPVRRIGIPDFLLTFFVLAVSYPLVGVLNALSMLVADNAVAMMSDEIVSEPFPLMLAIVGIGGPVCEELVFRGYIFQSFARTGKTGRAAVLSAVLFGLMHLNLNQAAYAAFLGLVFALADSAAGSILPSIVMHCIFNSVSVYSIYGESSTAASEGEGLLQISGVEAAGMLVFCAGCVVLLVWLIKGMKGFSRPENRRVFAPSGERLIGIPLMIGIGIAGGYIAADILLANYF